MIRALVALFALVLAGMATAEEATTLASDVMPPCEVRFFTYVDSDTMGDLLSEIEDPEVCTAEQRVRITVQSGGGDVEAGMFAYKMLRKRSGGVDTHVEYSAASMAIILLLAGDTRTMASDAHLLVHQLTTYSEGETELDKGRERVEGLEILHKDYVQFVAERTGLSTAEVEDLMENHTYLTAPEALRLGFITAITDA